MTRFTLKNSNIFQLQNITRESIVCVIQKSCIVRDPDPLRGNSTQFNFIQGGPFKLAGSFNNCYSFKDVMTLPLYKVM